MDEILSDGDITSQHELNRSRSAAILESKSLFAYPLSKTYSVPNINKDFSVTFTLFHDLYDTKYNRYSRPRAYTTYRSYFPYKNYESSELNKLYWNDKNDSFSNAHSRRLQPAHYAEHLKTPYFMNYSCTQYPNKYIYNDIWYNYKLPSYYRNFYYVSPYYDYYCNNSYNYRYNYRYID